MKNLVSNSSAPQSKLSQLREAAAADDWQQAIRIAARFPKLEAAYRSRILDAHTAYTNPRFLAQLGKCPEAAKLAGREALIAAYRIA